MGKLIIFEGLDGSGKGTQAELACQNLHSKGYDPLKISFPDYDSPSSALVKMYLSGEFGQRLQRCSPMFQTAADALGWFSGVAV